MVEDNVFRLILPLVGIPSDGRKKRREKWRENPTICFITRLKIKWSLNGWIGFSEK
jgi:hypothetical protein